MKNILITGGTGFIGSHVCLNFLEEGFNLTIRGIKKLYTYGKKERKLTKDLGKKK